MKHGYPSLLLCPVSDTHPCQCSIPTRHPYYILYFEHYRYSRVRVRCMLHSKKQVENIKHFIPPYFHQGDFVWCYLLLGWSNKLKANANPIMIKFTQTKSLSSLADMPPNTTSKQHVYKRELKEQQIEGAWNYPKVVLYTGYIGHDRWLKC